VKIKAVGAGLVAIALAALLGCGAEATGGAEDPVKRAQPEASSTSATPSDSHARLAPDVLQSRWWTWASAEPERTNPVADQDGSECGRNQPKDVWFLAGTFGTQAERECSVPNGVPLAFPLVNMIGEPADCADFMSAAKGSALLDGKRLDSDTHQGETIVVRSVADNAVTGTEGRFTTTGCGLWVQLPPLEPGDHALTIRGRSDGFAVGVDYVLTVDAA
jgi:hypothetical protein